MIIDSQSYLKYSSVDSERIQTNIDTSYKLEWTQFQSKQPDCFETVSRTEILTVASSRTRQILVTSELRHSEFALVNGYIFDFWVDIFLLNLDMLDVCHVLLVRRMIQSFQVVWAVSSRWTCDNVPDIHCNILISWLI